MLRVVDGAAMQRPAIALLHPAALVALVALMVNDHVFKAAWPGFVTGKLSDVAGLVVAPLAIVAAWEVMLWGLGRWRGPRARPLAVAIVAVGVGFAAIQVSPPAVEAWRWGLGLLQWPLRALGTVASGQVPGAPLPVAATPDLTDLLALPALALSWWVGRRSMRGVPR